MELEKCRICGQGFGETGVWQSLRLQAMNRCMRSNVSEEEEGARLLSAGDLAGCWALTAKSKLKGGQSEAGAAAPCQRSQCQHTATRSLFWRAGHKAVPEQGWDCTPQVPSCHKFPRNPPTAFQTPPALCEGYVAGVAAKWGHHSSGIPLHPFHQPMMPSAPG